MVRPRQRRQHFPGQQSLAAIALLLAAASGCKSGSWASRPSWMGGVTPSASTLGAAPSFDKTVAKPSETAKPYPTTTTPEGYVLSDTTQTAGAASPPATGLAPTEPSAVTYGSATAAAQPADPRAYRQAPTTPATAPQSITSQVGPYAALEPASDPTPAADAAATVTAGLAAAPAFGEAAAPGTSPVPPASERMADARSSGWVPTPPNQPMQQTPPVQPANPAPVGGQDSRYGAATASRFSGGSQPLPPPASAPAGFADPGTLPPAVPAAPVLPATPPALPGTIQPPTRRPDPGYRPGGTSSYRPTKSLLAGEENAPLVQPVSFDSAPPPYQQ